ncbi:MAG: hypothetical protein K2X55_09205 [Burkholderiaceae bacterium]|nr:hypothetical protein [Burkholderiaceae bacterium]
MISLPSLLRFFTPDRAGARHLTLVLLLVLVALLAGRKAVLTGDFAEYLQMTVSVASHGSAEVRADDIATMRRLLSKDMTEQLDKLEAYRRDPINTPMAPGFYRGLDGNVYAIHFPAYSALAAVPFTLFQWIGIPPLKAYQALNLAILPVLALALLHLFAAAPASGTGMAHPGRGALPGADGAVLRAGAGVALFMLCGGALYWNWSGPEFISAAALLAGLAWYASGAPLRGGALVGLAAMQNPSIILTLGMMPVLAWSLQPGVSLWQGVRNTLRPRTLGGLLLGGALAATPVLYNLHVFGTPSIIASISTAASMMNPGRLHSLFFDFNQGMILAIPAAWAMLLLWGWRGMPQAERRCRALALLLCMALAVAYAIPALTVHNWNSGAAGVMRYAFWSAMPFVFLLLWRLRGAARWPRVLLALVFAVQALAMAAGMTYNSVQLSPLATFVLQRMPTLYNPDPEIFAERVSGSDDFHANLMAVYVLRDGNTIRKALYHRTHPAPASKLCRPNETLDGSGSTHRQGDWIYLNGPLRCFKRTVVTADQFSSGVFVSAGSGWSVLEPTQGQQAGGMWSDGAVSQLTVAYAQPGKHAQLVIRGNYFTGNRRTRVVINGVDLGNFNLQVGESIPIPDAATTSGLHITLHHETPRSPGPQDGRKLALFLQQVSLQ